MKNLKTIILAFFLALGVNASYSQFYDVKIVKSPKTVSTRREPTGVKEEKSDQTGEKNVLRSEKMNANALKGSDGMELPVADGKAAGTDGEVPDMGAASGVERPMFCAPLENLVVSSGYGYRKDPFTGKRKFHAGTDYVTHSENVYAMMPGRIRKIGYDRKLGNFITLDHGDIQVTYAHLHTVVGRKDDTVVAGQSVGLSGSTGRSTGEHLHVSIKHKKKPVDPEPLIRAICGYANLRKVIEKDKESELSANGKIE